MEDTRELSLSAQLWPPGSETGQAPGTDLPWLHMVNRKSKAEVKNDEISHCPNKPEGFHHWSFPLRACRKEFQIKLLIQSNPFLAQPVVKPALSELLKSTELPLECSSAVSPLSLHFRGLRACRTHSQAPMKSKVFPKFWDGLFPPRTTDKTNLDSWIWPYKPGSCQQALALQPEVWVWVSWVSSICERNVRLKEVTST